MSQSHQTLNIRGVAGARARFYWRAAAGARCLRARHAKRYVAGARAPCCSERERAQARARKRDIWRHHPNAPLQAQRRARRAARRAMLLARALLMLRSELLCYEFFDTLHMSSTSILLPSFSILPSSSEKVLGRKNTRTHCKMRKV